MLTLEVAFVDKLCLINAYIFNLDVRFLIAIIKPYTINFELFFKLCFINGRLQEFPI